MRRSPRRLRRPVARSDLGRADAICARLSGQGDQPGGNGDALRGRGADFPAEAVRVMERGARAGLAIEAGHVSGLQLGTMLDDLGRLRDGPALKAQCRVEVFGARG